MSALFLLLAMAGVQDAPAAPAPAPAPAPVDATDQLKRGLAQCSQPDDVKKMCRSITHFTPKPDGSYETDTMLFISPIGPITFETNSIVHVKNGAICGTATTKTIDKARLFEGPNPMPESRKWIILDRIEDAMTPILGKEVCTSFAAGDNGQMLASVTINGVARPEQQRVRWISAADGYAVGQ